MSRTRQRTQFLNSMDNRDVVIHASIAQKREQELLHRIMFSSSNNECQSRQTSTRAILVLHLCFFVALSRRSHSFLLGFSGRARRSGLTSRLSALSDEFLDNDLVGVRIDPSRTSKESTSSDRLCVVRSGNTVFPLCQHEDDVETDLFLDPREYSEEFWQSVTDNDVTGRYGEGWYGQRPVPSLGGGPGYGAEADEIWSVSEELLTQLSEENVEIPLLDVGISHGEQARAGAF